MSTVPLSGQWKDMSAHDASRLGGHINKRHNTKQNAGPKMQLGKDDENLEEYYEGSRSRESTDNAGAEEQGEQDYVLDEVPVSMRAAQEERMARHIGVPTSSDSHMGPLIAGSNIASSAYQYRASTSPSRRVYGQGPDAGFGSSSSSSSAAIGEMRAGGHLQAGSGGAGDASSGAGLLSLRDYKKRADEVIKEFFVEGDYDEARMALRETEVHHKHTGSSPQPEQAGGRGSGIDVGAEPQAGLGTAPFFSYEFVRRLLIGAMERDDASREMASRLLSSLYGSDLSMEQIGKGVERLFESIDQVEIDVPHARDMAARFLARAVSDEVLPPAMVTDPIVRSMAGDICEQARVLLEVDTTSERLHHVWQVTSAFTVPELKKSIDSTVAEYWIEGEVQEAVRCVKEMEVPHFHHEVVYRTLARALDTIRKEGDLDGAVATAMRLFKSLRTEGVVSPAQFCRGFDRLRDRLPDLQLDSPRAKPHFDAFVHAAVEIGILPSRYIATTATIPAGHMHAAGDVRNGMQPIQGTVAGADTHQQQQRRGAGMDTPVTPERPYHSGAGLVQ